MILIYIIYIQYNILIIYNNNSITFNIKEKKNFK